MFYIGIDLAWGQRKPTGVAVLDQTGRLVALTSVRTDAEVIAELAEYAPGDCLVAIDAPLVVQNATGNRPGEAALNRDFARFQAGAHPSNTTRREFADQPRAARLAVALGLDIDPHSTHPRRALEVYPHPAIVALFRLERTLKYKNKPGRTIAGMRSELLRLTGLLGGLHTEYPPLRLHRSREWAALVEAVSQASRKSELRVAEDKVDAVVCAYIAAYSARRPADITIYGDLAQGYIVTPTLPEDMRPSGARTGQPQARGPRVLHDSRPTPGGDTCGRQL
ncbi:MAG: DUF429 domain-containing protein [Nocardioides sp.]